jgi:predicted metal-binding protein
MGAVDQAIQDGVGQRGIADVVMPVVHGQLAGHDAGTGSGTVVEEFEQIVAFPRTDGCDGEVVDDQHVDLGDRRESLGEAAIGMAEVKLLEQARCPNVQRTHTLSASLVGQGAREVRLAAAGRTSDILPNRIYSM